MRITLILCLSIFGYTLSFSQEEKQDTPQWFTDNLTEQAGIWRTDNSRYKSEQEVMDYYEIEWKWGIGKKSITGTMYGIIDGEHTGAFWEFRQYWDFEKQQGIVQQFGRDGTMGSGPLEYINQDSSRLSQSFHGPGGAKFLAGHITVHKKGEQLIQSFFISEENEWKPNREYVFIKQEEK